MATIVTTTKREIVVEESLQELFYIVNKKHKFIIVTEIRNSTGNGDPIKIDRIIRVKYINTII